MLTIFLRLLGILPPSIFIVDLIRPPLFLISAFLSSYLILFSMEIEFVSFVFIMLYVGVTAIIFLFEVVTISVEHIENTSPGGLKVFIVVCSCAGLFFNEWSFFFYIKEFFFLYLDMLDVCNSFDSLNDFYYSSYLVYSFHSFIFSIEGLILLIILLLTMDFVIILVFLLVELIELLKFVCWCLKLIIFSLVKKYIHKK